MGTHASRFARGMVRGLVRGFQRDEHFDGVSWVSHTVCVRLPKPKNHRKFEGNPFQWGDTATSGVPFECFPQIVQVVSGDNMTNSFDGDLDNHAVLGQFEIPFVTMCLIEWPN